MAAYVTQPRSDEGLLFGIIRGWAECPQPDPPDPPDPPPPTHFFWEFSQKLQFFVHIQPDPPTPPPPRELTPHNLFLIFTKTALLCYIYLDPQPIFFFEFSQKFQFFVHIHPVTPPQKKKLKKKKKKKNFFFFFFGGGGSQGGCEQRIEIFVKIQKKI